VYFCLIYHNIFSSLRGSEERNINSHLKTIRNDFLNEIILPDFQSYQLENTAIKPIILTVFVITKNIKGILE